MAFRQLLDTQPLHQAMGEIAFKGSRPGQSPTTFDAAHEHSLFNAERKIPIDSFYLWHISDPPRRPPAKSLTTDKHLPLSGDNQPKNSLEKSRFACTAWPQYPGKLTFVEVQIDIFQHVCRAVSASYVAKFDHRHTHNHSPRLRITLSIHLTAANL